MKTNLRKEASLGVILVLAYLALKIFFNGNGFFMAVLGIAGLALLVIGLLPEEMHQKVLDLKNKLIKK